MKAYLTSVQRASYNYLFAAVLLLLYEIGTFAFEDSGVRNGVDVWFEQFLHLLPNGTLLVSGGLLLAGIAVVIYDMRQGVELKLSHFVVMFIESWLWALVVWFAVVQVVQTILPNQVGPSGSLTQNIFLSFGAGFYEELFFRLILVKLLEMGAIVLGYQPQMIAVRLLVILITATLFSLAHFNFIIGDMGDPFALHPFLFRLVFGMMMSFLLIFRGFGITAWSHALYDVMIFTLRA